MRRPLSILFTAFALVAVLVAGVVAGRSVAPAVAQDSDTPTVTGTARATATATVRATGTEEATEEAEETESLEVSETAEEEDITSTEGFVDDSMPRYITVVGQGSSGITPDIAVMNLGADTQAPVISDAIDQNDELMAAVMQALTDAGIAEEDIQTSNYSVYFDEGFRGLDVQAEPVYRVSNTVMVTVRDLETVGDLLDAVIAAGANRIYGVSFTVDDWSAAESEARSQAMDDARARATELAGLAGVELGGVMNISEVVGGIPPTFYGREAAMGGGGGPITPGQLEFSTSVQVSFAIR